MAVRREQKRAVLALTISDGCGQIHQENDTPKLQRNTLLRIQNSISRKE